MPLPIPKEDEKQDDFISRCMSNDSMKSEFKDNDQRLAVCFSQWRRAKTNKEEFHCECIECGYKVTSEEHCAKMRCPKCGGQMRREERPGPGEDLTKEGMQFFKKDTKKQIVYGIVWEPGFEDAQGEWASKDDIEEAAHEYLIHHREVKLSHGMNITKDVSLVECYLAPVDFECNGQTIKEGTWIVGLKVLDKDYWDAVESGEIQGLSAGGMKTFVEGGGA